MSTPATQSAIIWPEKFLPGTTNNYVSNEVIVANLTAAQIWPLLADLSKWETYYKNCEKVSPPSTGSTVKKGDHFSFCTFGFPALPSTVEECVEPTTSTPGRLAWACSSDGVEVYHAWLVEDLPGGRVRVLTQESQIGEVFDGIRDGKPNVMLLGHQDWLEALVATAKGQKLPEQTNLGSTGKWERK